MRIFVLIMGIVGVYVSSAFVRLEVFASISLIFLTSIGLSILIKEIFKINLSKKKNYSLKISSITIIFILFTIPLVYPTTSNWINSCQTFHQQYLMVELHTLLAMIGQKHLNG